MRALSLFSGIGGLDLAAEACGIETVAMCEIEEFPVSILKKRWSDVPIYDDVRKIKGSEIRGRLGAVDVVHGGFPCQDLSVAGKRAGLVCGGGYTRSGLWYEMLRIISELRPRFVVGENVRGAVSLALDEVQRGLEDEDYEVRTFLIPASSVGAPHQRERIFVLGIRKDVLGIEGEYRSRPSLEYANDVRLQRRSVDGTNREAREVGAAHEAGESSAVTCWVWRTPDANMTRGAISEEKYVERVQRGMPNSLNYQVAHEERRWSTPQACDGGQGAVIGKEDVFKRLPDGRLRKINKNGVDGSIGLAREVVLENRNWPTVCATETRQGYQNRNNGKKGTQKSLSTVVIDSERDCLVESESSRGQLNPQWVEQLMGYPDGWTDPDCDDPTPWMGWPARPGEPQYPYEHPRTVVGMKNRAKRLKALGNSVVPQQAEPIFRTIAFIDYMTGGQ